MEQDTKNTKQKIRRYLLRLPVRLLQGALIGLGSVLPGISGGVLSVVFGVYKPVMELLASPGKHAKTHLPRLLPYFAGAAIGFLGAAGLLTYFLEKYPAPSICLFVGLIAGMLPLPLAGSGEQRTEHEIHVCHRCCYALCICFSILFTYRQPYHHAGIFVVFILWLCPCFKHHCARYELFRYFNAIRALRPFRGRHRTFGSGCGDSRRHRMHTDHHFHGKGSRHPA